MQHLSIPEVLTAERIILQRLRYEDAEEMFFAYASKEEATRFVSWPTHRSVKDTRQFLLYAIPAWSKGHDYTFSIRLKDSYRLIGSFGIINDRGKIQFGYIISPTQWGRGYATEACNTVLPVLRAMPEVYRIGTFVDADNVASIRVLQKCGLVEEARLPGWFRFVNQNNQPKDCILFKIPL
ncbi:MAG: GNAT family N-acetyltransferase [Cyclobacteriaceae bacterium]|nr:GNAT family N-acetyltransferase [Cyclobacteriaceae bacterium]